MSAGAPTEDRSVADKLGITPGAIVLEIGNDDDSDETLRTAVAQRAAEVVGDDTEEVVDVVLLWWREDDGDLVDALVDSLTPLGDGGVVWLLTPKSGRDGHVEPSDIAEAAPTAGLSETTTISASPDWTGTRLVTRGGRR